MHYEKNHVGNRIVVATPAETHALSPCICAAFRRWRCPEGDIEAFAQDVELTTWVALTEKRVMGDRYARPRDALLAFMFQIAWNLWRNYSRRNSTRCEILHDELPDIEGPDPDPRYEARDALRRIAARPGVGTILLLSLQGPRPERDVNLPRATFWRYVAEARKEARRIMTEHSRKPPQPIPPTPWKRKGKR
jgi:hypothetical protein